jgi:hypothetical protein
MWATPKCRLASAAISLRGSTRANVLTNVVRLIDHQTKRTPALPP